MSAVEKKETIESFGREGLMQKKGRGEKMLKERRYGRRTSFVTVTIIHTRTDNTWIQNTNPIVR